MRKLEVGDIIQKVHIDRHTNTPDKIIYEQIIERTTKKFAFGGSWKISIEPIYDNIYRRYDYSESHFEIYRLKG